MGRILAQPQKITLFKIKYGLGQGNMDLVKKEMKVLGKLPKIESDQITSKTIQSKLTIEDNMKELREYLKA